MGHVKKWGSFFGLEGCCGRGKEFARWWDGEA